MDNLKNEDINPRKKSVKSLNIISDMIGPERTRSEMMPFLMDCMDDEDEVLVMLAEVLGTMAQQVGGSQYVHTLFPPLESLCGAEDLTVRQKAVASLIRLISLQSGLSVEVHAIELLHRLSTNEYLAARSSAAGLIPTILKQSPTKKREDVLNTFNTLCKDESPIVRRSAVHYIKPLTLANLLDKPTIRSNLIPLANHLATDPQDNIRICLIEVLISLASALTLTVEESKTHILPLFRSLMTDKSWRVRFKVAESFPDIGKVLKAEIVKTELITHFCSLLKDVELEVKIIAASKMSAFAAFLSSDIIVKQLLPTAKEQIKNDNVTFKESLASGLFCLSPFLSKSDFSIHLLPSLLDFFTDTNAEVKMAALANLQAVVKVVDIDTLSSRIISSIVSLSQDKHWRVRLTLVENVVYFAQKIGSSSFDDKLLSICVSWLEDCVFSVREGVVLLFKKLGSSFGKGWIKNSLIPKLIPLAKNKSYIKRETALSAFVTLVSPSLPSSPSVVTSVTPSSSIPSPSPSSSLLSDDVLGGKEGVISVVILLTKDAVPNVRFTAVRTLRMLYQSTDSLPLKKEIKAGIDKLTSDGDDDVKFFAQQSLKEIN